jgi:hypothetical protein
MTFRDLDSTQHLRRAEHLETSCPARPHDAPSSNVHFVSTI